MAELSPIQRAGRTLVAARERRDSLPVEQAAAEAWMPGGPPVETIAARIRRQRGVDSGHAAA